MSAWYIFAAIGFYPVNPVSGDYMLCSPLFDSISLKSSGNTLFRVICHRTDKDDVYIKKVTFNGVAYDRNFITHALIMKGGKLEIWLQATPSAWGNNR